MGPFPAVLIAALTVAAAILGACGSVTSGVGSSSSGAGGAGGGGGGGAGFGGASASGGSGVGGMGTGGECEPYVARVYPFVVDVERDGGPATPPCTFAFPAPPLGVVKADYEVNLRFSSADVEPFIIGQVASESACGPYGWYFDGSSPPTEMLVCPTTCAMFQASNGVIIDLLFGCPTVLAR